MTARQRLSKFISSKIHYFVYVAIFLCTILIIANEVQNLPTQFTPLDPKTINKLLENNKNLASVVVGNGDKSIYVFIDPLCSMSQEFVETLYNNKLYKSDQFKIYLFLYHLDRKPSIKHIYTIMESDEPEITLKDIMISKNVPLNLCDDPSTETINKIHAIETLAQKISVYKRPYIISQGRMIGEN
jgi:hypothetical protein